MNSRILAFALEDRFFRARLEEVVAEHGITTIVETGLDKGLSAIVLAAMVERYVGIDIDSDCVNATVGRLNEAGLSNYDLIIGNSADILPEVVRQIDAARALFFLDAHCFGDTDCPILHEIAAIPRGQGVLVFHDIWPPGRAAGGFSPMINGVLTRLDYDLLRPELVAWSPSHRVEYLAEYETDLAPGVMFAYPE